MNATIKQWMLSCFATSAFIVLHAGCFNSSTNPLESQTSAFEISDIKNIVWTLQAVEKAGRVANIPVTFHLIYNEERFFGDDGCNSFGGRYEARNDSIFPDDIIQTEKACANATFPIQHLAEPYRMQIAKNELRLFAKDAIYTYKSDVTDSITNNPLIKTWILSAATDPEFADIQRQQLIPTLLFDESRGFKLAWYCASGNTFGCDEIFGIFGVGAGGKILFYPTGWQQHAPGSEFMQRILSASSYSFAEETLLLFNESTGAMFEFKAVRK
jgi:heat shock protein HslJ